METIIKKLAESIESNLIHDMNCEQTGDDTAILVLNAYNLDLTEAENLLQIITFGEAIYG